MIHGNLSSGFFQPLGDAMLFFRQMDASSVMGSYAKFGCHYHGRRLSGVLTEVASRACPSSSAAYWGYASTFSLLVSAFLPLSWALRPT